MFTNRRKKAILVFEDGTFFKGLSLGAGGEIYGEIVFNTSMSGYQEILTDPSYRGQIVTMTYPLIGNYGVNSQDVESRKPYVSGFVVKESSRITSNWRSEKSLAEYLKENNIVGIEGVDTRALTKHIRLRGAMKVVISTKDFDSSSLVEKVKASEGLIGRDLVKDVTCAEPYYWSKEGRYKVVVIDCGVKFNILRKLTESDCRVMVVPANYKAEDILKEKPEGILLSNGPGDPQGVPYVVETVKNLLGKVPMFGICLGHQMLGLALGGKTYKLKFGHHGGNHPVKDLKTTRVAITVQNHGFCVDLKQRTENREQKTENKYYMAGNEDIEVTHINLNDATCEGMRHKKLPVFSVQFHPESRPGPHDAEYLFKEFIEMIEKNKNRC